MNSSRKIVRALCAVALGLGLALSASAQQELIINGGFETGSLAPWYNCSPGYYWWVTGQTGSHCAYTYYGGFGAAFQQDLPPTQTNQITSVTYWARGYYNAQLDEVPLTITFYYQSGATSSGGPWITQTWTQYNITSSLSPNQILTAIRITAGGDPYMEPWHYIDDISILANIIAPNVQITLTPISTPIVIPATGGFFDFNLTVANNGTSPQAADVWTMCQAPNTFWVGPIFYAFGITLPSSSSITRLRTQYIPPFAPAGTYTYEGRIGIYPNYIWDADNFTFTKSGAEEGDLGIGDWANTGEDFTSDVGAQRAAPMSGSGATPTTVISPNPFNPTTVARYKIQNASYVSLRVYDITGRLVITLVEGWREAGRHQVKFDGTNLPSGIYLYHLQAGETTNSGKMILMK